MSPYEVDALEKVNNVRRGPVGQPPKWFEFYVCGAMFVGKPVCWLVYRHGW